MMALSSLGGVRLDPYPRRYKVSVARFGAVVAADHTGSVKAFALLGNPIHQRPPFGA